MLYQNRGEQVKTYVYMSQCMIFPTMWYVQPAKPQMSLCKSIEYSMIVKLLTEHHLEFLSLKEGCTGSSESTLVKMPHCWKSHVGAPIYILTGCWSDLGTKSSAKGFKTYFFLKRQIISTPDETIQRNQ